MSNGIPVEVLRASVTQAKKDRERREQILRRNQLELERERAARRAKKAKHKECST